MNNDRYIERTHKKIEAVLELYAAHIFRTVDTAKKVYAYHTTEHLRKPPMVEEMTEIAPNTNWGEEWGNMWLRTSYTVPAELEGEQLCVIPDANAVEILCFKNGKPAGIINSKNQFIGGTHSAMFVEASAKAGSTIDLAFDCYAGHD